MVRHPAVVRQVATRLPAGGKGARECRLEGVGGEEGQVARGCRCQEGQVVEEYPLGYQGKQQITGSNHHY